MSKTKIEWAEYSWNPIVGCTKCSPGCLNCYAERMAKRQVAMGCARGGDNTATWVAYSDAINPETGKWSGDIALRPDLLDKPLHWRNPKRIFPCSMSDLFHEKVPFEFIDKMLYVMYRNLQHTFLILTKRSERMLEYFADGELLRLRLLRLFPNYTPEARLCREWPLDNLHLGVSISNQAEADEKIPILLQIPAAVRWLSIEPMLGPIKDICHGFDRLQVPFNRKMVDGWFWEELSWVVVGCESGPKRRPCKIEWVESIVDQCKAASVPLFVKQINQDGKVVKMPKEFPQELPERI